MALPLLRAFAHPSLPSLPSPFLALPSLPALPSPCGSYFRILRMKDRPHLVDTGSSLVVLLLQQGEATGPGTRTAGTSLYPIFVVASPLSGSASVTPSVGLT